MVQEISHVNSQSKYIILNCQNSKEKWELNVQAKVKTKNGKNLKVKALVDSGCTHTGIDKQLISVLINTSWRQYEEGQRV